MDLIPRYKNIRVENENAFRRVTRGPQTNGHKDSLSHIINAFLESCILIAFFKKSVALLTENFQCNLWRS